MLFVEGSASTRLLYLLPPAWVSLYLLLQLPFSCFKLQILMPFVSNRLTSEREIVPFKLSPFKLPFVETFGLFLSKMLSYASLRCLMRGRSAKIPEIKLMADEETENGHLHT
jgi:hypothetical protein